MKYTRLVLFKDGRKPIKITEIQYQVYKPALNRDRFIEINGVPYNTSSIDSFPFIAKDEPISLPAPEEKPVSKEVLEKVKKEISKKFK